MVIVSSSCERQIQDSNGRMPQQFQLQLKFNIFYSFNQTIFVVEKCVEISNEISYKHGDFELRHAGVVDSEVNVSEYNYHAYTIWYVSSENDDVMNVVLLNIVSSENKLDARNPMAIVKNYIEEEGLRMLDFFKQMDKDHGGTISREEFIEGLAVRNKTT